MNPAAFDASGYLRQARRTADLSQRELAARAACPQTTVARIESRVVQPSCLAMRALLAAAGHDLQVIDGDGQPIEPHADCRRDAAFRLYPAHLDVRKIESADDWWYGHFMTTLDPFPPYTFDLSRARRDWLRRKRP